MFTLGSRFIAALTIVGSAIAFTGIGVALSNADESKAPDLSELRDAINAAAKRGENVDEIRKALDALQKSLASGFTAPAPGKTLEPSPELLALRETVESAAKKGENVEEIRKHLDVIEKALTGKILAKPKPLPPIDPVQPLRPNPGDNPFGPGNGFVRPPIQIMPGLVPGNGVDQEAFQKAQELIRKATELMLKNGMEDPESRKLLKQGNDMLMQAMLGGKRIPGGGLMINPDLGGGRVGDRFRLGVRLERVSELAADQLGLDIARGVGIADVVEGSAAQKAGFKTHDIVLEFAGKPVSDNPEDFTRLVASVKGGEKVDAQVMRKGKKIDLKGIVLPDQAQVIPFPMPAFDGVFPLPELNPVPRLERQRGEGEGRGRGRVGNSVSYSIVNGQAVIKAVQDGVQYVIQGERKDDGIEATKITITEGEKKTEYEKLDKVPEEQRRVVDDLLKGIKNRRLPRP